MKLYQWDDLAGKFNDGLILGNGASIAVNRCFSYGSLYDEATRSLSLDSAVKAIFESYETQDFELVLRLLWTAHQVNAVFGVHDVKVIEAYDRVRDALITTIHQAHVSYTDAKPHLPKIVRFLMPFERVLSLNYDLLVYWAMMDGNTQFGPWFKDCFTQNRRFREDFKFLAKPYGEAAGATLVFYPHGNLILGTGRNSQISKIVNEEHADLLDTITKQWTLEHCTPLFVSEGSSGQKDLAIHRHSYLQFVFTNVLPKIKWEGSFTCFGWSMSPQDKHLLEALGKNRPKRLAISIYTESPNWENYLKEVQKNLCDIRFSGHRNLLLRFRK